MERLHDNGHHEHVQSQVAAPPESVPGGVLISAKGLTLEPLRTRFEVGVRSPFEFRIRDHVGNVVTGFEHVHDAGLHLIVVRRDVTLFQHLHPEVEADGRWSVDLAPRSRWEWTSLQTVNCAPSIRVSRNTWPRRR